MEKNDLREFKEQFKYCNCAGCSKLLLGDRHREWYDQNKTEVGDILPPPVCGRINGRPYCSLCLASRKPRTGTSSPKEAAPSWDNIIRLIEG